jgi:TonB family protein
MTHALSAALLHFVWQGLAVTIVLWLALFAMRKRSASLRYGVSCAALAVLVLLPVLTTWALSSGAGGTVVPRGLKPGPLDFSIRAAPAHVDWLALLQSWAVPVWACGVLIFSLRMIWGCTRIAAMRRAGTSAEAPMLSTFTALADRMSLTRPVQLLLSTVTDSPCVTGWLRPMVLLPISAATGLTADQLEGVLAHELAHICRHDYLVNLLQMAAETLLFYHPAVWWISNRIREERELCCDDLAVRVTGGALEYARALTALEKMRLARPVVALGSTDGPLFYRILRLVTGGGEYGPSKLSGAVALALSVVCVALCVNWARGQEPAHEAVTVNTTGAVLLHRSAIAYPESLREKGVQGTVSVEVTLDTSGEVSDARILSGPEELRKPVLASVLNWHFAPGGGTTRVVEVTFQRQTVVLNVTVDPNGTATGIRVTQSAGLERDKQAVEEVKQRKFDPAQGTSQTVRVSVGDEKPQVEQAGRLVVTTRGADGEPESRTARLQSMSAQLEGEIERNRARVTYQELIQKLLDRRAQLVILQKTYGPNHPEIVQLRKEVAELEQRVQVAHDGTPVQAGLATQATNAEAEEVKIKMAQVMGRIVEMRRSPDTPAAELALAETELQRMRALLAETVSHSMAGRKLAAIEIRGLSDEAGADLLSRLPVHEGDTLTTESMESTQRVARQFDSHLEVSFGGEPEGAFLRIHPAGRADGQLLRRK